MDEATIGQEEVWPAVADVDGQFDDQAAVGLGFAGAEPLDPVPRDYNSCNHTLT